MAEKRNTYRVLVGKSEGREHLENVVLDCRITLKLPRSRMEVRKGFVWLKKKTVVRC
jgi:hypothetical protein